MDCEEPAQSLLLELPDPCLLAVLQCCAANDLPSLFSAAQANSRLHQAAVVALRSITTELYTEEQGDSLLLYLQKYGQYVDSLELSAAWSSAVVLPHLPPDLQLSSLQVSGLRLQLQPGSGFVLGAAGLAGLKQLHLIDCSLVGEGRSTAVVAAVAAALSQLPAAMEELSICRVCVWARDDLPIEDLQFPITVLQQLQQLTYLQLNSKLQEPDQDQLPLQPLQALTRLVDLRVGAWDADSVTASLLSGIHHLTCLELSHCNVEPGVLADRTLLQHLHLRDCEVTGGADGEARLLFRLQDLQQLTHLGISDSFRAAERNNPPAAAYAALAASSRLQELDIGRSTMPAGVWQHIFPAGRQLPHLQDLDISWAKVPSQNSAPAPDGSRLVSCCPGLRCLNLQGLQYSAELLAPLQGLDSLHTLLVGIRYGVIGASVVPVCQLTTLRNLQLEAPYGNVQKGRLLQLTQLKQLTALTYKDLLTPHVKELSLSSEAPGDEPVWRQLLWLHLDCDDREVAEEAAASLAEV